MEEKYDIIIPVSGDHIQQLLLSVSFIKKNLNPKNILIICSLRTFQKIDNPKDLLWLDENGIFKDLRYDEVRRQLISRGASGKRAGWYFQQFLKMQYASICKDKYYIVWDADTIPLKKIKFIEDGKMLINKKNEHHIPYFETLDRIFGKGKMKYADNYSYISEGMIINAQYMRDLIDMILKSQNVEGNLWFEKVLNSIAEDELELSGFSEFETYGNFLHNYHFDEIKYRQLITMRDGYDEYGRLPNIRELENLIPTYDTVSFENRYSKNIILPQINNIVDFKKENVFSDKMYMQERVYNICADFENELTSRIKAAQCIYIFGAGGYGRTLRFFINLKGMGAKLSGYVVTKKKDIEQYGLPIYSAEEFFDKEHNTDDLVVIATRQSIRDEIFNDYDWQDYNVIEFCDEFGDNIQNAIITREIRTLISGWKTIGSFFSEETVREVLIVDLRIKPDLSFIDSYTVSKGKSIDLILREGIFLPEKIIRRTGEVYYYPATDIPEHYNTMMRTRVLDYIREKNICQYNKAYILGELPVLKSNYLEAVMLCIYCCKKGLRIGYLKRKSEVYSYYVDIWSDLFNVYNEGNVHG